MTPDPSTSARRPRLDFAIVLAVSIAIPLFFRAWRDGIAFSAQNAYFTIALMLPATLWCAALIFDDRSKVQHRILTALLAGMAAVVGITTVWSIHFDYSARAILNWITYFFVFAVAVNGLTTPAARGIVFTTLCITLSLGAAWALFHLYVIMPNIREVLAASPRAVSYYFGSSEIAPALAHRLQVNRAYGATLFPNALAALLVIAIPAQLGALVSRVREDDGAETAIPEQTTMRAAGFYGALAAILSWTGARLALGIITRQVPGWQDSVLLENAIRVLPMISIVAGLLIAIAVRRIGARTFFRNCEIILLPVGIIVCVAALVLTYSRGAMLGLLIASAWTGLVVYVPGKGARAAVATVILLCAAFLGLPGDAQTAELERGGLSADITNLTSVDQRLSYWTVAASMISANFVHGVGPGAYGVAYPAYMYAGAAESRHAHNDYLQVFAETGIAGFVLFTAFWGAFLVVGARKVRYAAPERRACLAGIYAGVVAFLVHAFVDFNFANASLATIVFAFAGLFLAMPDRSRVALSSRPREASVAAQVSAAFGLLVIAAAIIASGYIFSVDYALTGDLQTAQKLRAAGSRLELRDRLNVARFYLSRIQESENKPNALLYGNYGELRRIIPDANRILSFGVPASVQEGEPPSVRPLAPGEEITASTSILIRNADGATAALYDSADALLNDLGRIDAMYPHIFDVAIVAAEWNDLLRVHARTGEAQVRYASEAVRWSKAAVQRSPENSHAYSLLGKTTWYLAGYKSDPALAEADYRAAIDAFRKSCALHPSSPRHWLEYAETAEALAGSFKSVGRIADYEELHNAAVAARLRAEQLEQ